MTRFHYTNPVHPKLCVITGMTRDGTFLVEDGKIVGPVRNLRYTQSYLDALAGVAAVEQRAQDAPGLPRRRRRPRRPHRRLELHRHDGALTATPVGSSAACRSGAKSHIRTGRPGILM